ncbi:MAG: cation transporter, partial [Paracoccaceae bacterium]
MSDVAHAPLSACPACAAAPLALHQTARNARLVLSLPGAHCAACMAVVERALQSVPGVRSARVILTLKRVSVDAAAGV